MEFSRMLYLRCILAILLQPLTTVGNHTRLLMRRPPCLERWAARKREAVSQNPGKEQSQSPLKTGERWASRRVAARLSSLTLEAWRLGSN